jgi:hypothetical protein
MLLPCMPLKALKMAGLKYIFKQLKFASTHKAYVLKGKINIHTRVVLLIEEARI